MINLTRALRLNRALRLAFVGAGGKTSALFRLARELDPPVIVTTTTHLGEDQAALADLHLILEKPEDLERLPNPLPDQVILVSGPPVLESRLGGLSFELFSGLAARVQAYGSGRNEIPLLVEADGSRMRPLKAPAAHEPALPAEVDQVVVVAGLAGLGKPLTGKWVHRPERFADQGGIEPGAEITVEALARLLAHPQGGLKNIPPAARRVLLLNGAGTPALQAGAARLAHLLRETYDAVLVANIPLVTEPNPGEPEVAAVYERTAGVILAAGAARRYGQAKLLLPWRGEPLVRHSARTALQAGLSPVVVVAGAELEGVRQALEGLAVQVVHNPDWEAGQSTSVRAGLRALPEACGGAVFLLADQPQIPASLIQALVETHTTTLTPLVAPMVDGKRGNPVLFDRELFPELLSLSGDTGGRALFSRYPVVWIPWHDAAPLLDVDTPEDYRRLLEMQ